MIINSKTSDEAFKANYAPEILSRKSTVSLKTSFHIINIVLMGICKVLSTIDKSTIT